MLEKKGEENKERLQPKGGKSQKQSYQLKDCEDGNLPKLMKIEKNQKDIPCPKSVPTTEVAYLNPSIHIRVAKIHEAGLVAYVQTHQNIQPTQRQFTPRQPLTRRHKTHDHPGSKPIGVHQQGNLPCHTTSRHFAPRRHLPNHSTANQQTAHQLQQTYTETKTGRRTCTTDHSWRFMGRRLPKATPGRQARSAKLIRRFPHKRKQLH